MMHGDRATTAVLLLLLAVCGWVHGENNAERLFEIVENTGVNQTVEQVLQAGGHSFNFTDGICGKYFTIDAASVIRTSVDLDREDILAETKTDELKCQVQYENTSNPAVQIIFVTIRILDLNDETPSFFNLEHPVHEIEARETIAIESPILTLQPIDNDKGQNGTVTYNITGGNEREFFRLGNDFAMSPIKYLYLQKALDFETIEQFNLTITISDMGEPEPRSNTQYLVIDILNSDEGDLFFETSEFDFEIPENHPIGPDSPIGNVTVDVIDGDINAVLYSFFCSSTTNENDPEVYTYFSVEAHTGKVYLLKELDYEDSMLRKFTFDIVARDPGSNKCTRASVTVDVTDVNDEAPFFTVYPDPESSIIDEKNIEIQENLNTSSWPNEIIRFQIWDGDATIKFQEITNLTAVFDPPVNSIEYQLMPFFDVYLAILRVNQTLDRELTPKITVQLTAYDKAEPPNWATITIFISVTDENDNIPQFSANKYYTKIAEDSPIGKGVIQVQASDPDYAENGTVAFSITGVDNPKASDWFRIDPSSGLITVNSTLDYSSVNGQVLLSVTASDSSLSNTTTVEIKLSPAVTFTPRSYQKHSGYDLTGSEIYLEFRTSAQKGLLLYQAGSVNKTLALEIVDERVRCSGHTSDTKVSDDTWYSVMVSESNESVHLEVWAADRQDQRVTDLLFNSTLGGCSSVDTHPLYVGGIDLLSPPDNVNLSLTPDFTGSIRNLVISGTQVDLSCPTVEEGTTLGFSSPGSTCGSSEQQLPCGEGASMCIDSAYCTCLGGFEPETCQEDSGYSPIQFNGASLAQISLRYPFFYDLLVHGDPSSPPTQRKKRQEENLEVVRVSFRPIDVRKGHILHSQTPMSNHILKIDEASNEQSIIYTVYNSDYSTVPIHIPLPLKLSSGSLYTTTIITTSSSVTMTIETEDSIIDTDSAGWNGHNNVLFAQAPETTVSIGGAYVPMSLGSTYFTGCITSLSINQINMPLAGMLKHSQGNGFSVEGTVNPNCNRCTSSVCPSDSNCISDHDGKDYTCQCLEGYELSGDNCVLVVATTMSPQPTLIPDGVLEPSSNEKFPIYYIIGMALGGLLICGVFISILIASLRYHHQLKKRTYHISHDGELGNGHLPTSRPNQYTNVTPKLDESRRSRQATPDPRDCESVMTYQQHDVDDDETSNNPSYSWRKSTTSAETGFQTGSERDERSIPRMEDSGNEKETDYSQFESESDELSCMEEALSPADVALVGSAPPSHYHVPLTPKERKVMTPLRPDSRLILSMSEFEDTDTEMFYGLKQSSLRIPKRTRKGSDSEAGRTSNPHSPQWYKSSTASDTERESKRAHATCAYYPTRSEPPHRHPPFNKSISVPPEYKPPPPFVQHKSMMYPPFSSRQHAVDSPLSTHYKYNHQGFDSPTSEPQRDSGIMKTPDLPHTKSQPMRMHSIDSNVPHRSSSSSPRHYSIDMPYSSGFGSTDTPQDGHQFRDLKSMKSRINPIAYWEGQARMKSAVDQDDPYHILSEPYVQFEDVSTEPSIAESTSTMMEEHHEFSSQGGGEGTADILDLSLTRLRDGDIDSMVTDGPELQPAIKHFPSADCSDEYTHTLVGSSSGDSTPKQLSNGFLIPSKSSQQPFDV